MDHGGKPQAHVAENLNPVVYAIDVIGFCLLSCRVVELTGDVTPDMRAVAQASLIVTTPEKWDGVSRSWQTRSYVKSVNLLVIDEIHLLGELNNLNFELVYHSSIIICHFFKCDICTFVLYFYREML